MGKQRQKLRSHCPVNFVLEVVGDKWSLLILRDIVFRGKKTYGEFLQSEEGFATNILAARLALLEEEGILAKRASEEDARKSYFALTEKGLDMIPLLFEMVLWSAKHDPRSQAKRIPRLVEQIMKNNRAVSKLAALRATRGEGILAEFLD